jgi:hypothetical protein
LALRAVVVVCAFLTVLGGLLPGSLTELARAAFSSMAGF